MASDSRSGTQQLFALALAHQQAGRLDDAERIYRRILQADPRHADALHFLGILNHERGNGKLALVLIRQAIAQRPSVPAFHNSLGMVLFTQGSLDEAAACYAQAVHFRPDYVQAHFNLGVAFQARGKRDAAAAAYQRALALKPDYVEAYNNLGVVHIDDGRPDLAVACLKRALSYQADHVDAHNNLGNALRATGRASEAIESYTTAIAHDSACVAAHLNLGRILIEQGRPAEAVSCLERALSLDPDRTKPLASLGTALREQGKLAESLAAYRDALAASPDNAEARLGEAIASIPIFAEDVAQSREATGKFMRALDALASWGATHTEELAQCVGSHLPFYLAYRPEDLRPALCRYGDIVCSATADQWRPAALGRGEQWVTQGRIRMLIVSAHVRRHPVWDVILRGLIAHIDRQKFELILYHSAATRDAQTPWAQSSVDRFVQGPKTTQGWIDEIGKDAPDVIFYPEVGMDPVTSLLATLRLAPLQLAAWGHPVTTGLPTMDCFLSGDLLEGPEADSHYRERLVRLPGTGVYTQMSDLEARPWNGSARSGAVVRFALCQQSIKFDPADDALLVQIAKRVGSCEFWLVIPEKLGWTAVKLRDRLARAFRAGGLDPADYLRLTPWLPSGQFLGFLDAMDISLDSPAFSGYTTAWQAVHRGLPIVTLAGRYLRQRLASGVLRQIGMEDQIARSSEEYVDLATNLAHERLGGSGRAAERRAAIRRAAHKSDNNVAAIRAFETAVIQLKRAKP